MTVIEKILAHHSTYDVVRPGEIVNIRIDIRVSRDLGGVNLVKQLKESNSKVSEPNNSFFTFDYYPSILDANISENHQTCRNFARENGIHLFDIHSGIGSHIMIDQGYVTPGSIMASTDSHANITGAIGALGISLNDKEIFSAFTKGSVWFRVPKTVKINLTGLLPSNITPKDLALNLLSVVGSGKFLGYTIEIVGPVIDLLSLDGRITLASMANEFGAITFFMPPNQEVMDYCLYKSNNTVEAVLADDDAEYEDFFNIDVSKFKPMIYKPGQMEIVPVDKELNKGFDSAFIGTCTNGRIEDLRIVAGILKGRKVAPGVILKIVPSTDEIWTLALQEGLIDIFKESGAMVASAGCGGCASGQYTQRNSGEVILSSGNKNFMGLASKGELYLTSPIIIAASSIAGYITTPELIPEKQFSLLSFPTAKAPSFNPVTKPTLIEGKIWYVPFDNIDTDMIYNSKYTELKDLSEFGNYTFSQLKGYEYFADKVTPGDIVIVGENFGLGNSSHHAIDCFKSLGIQAIIAKSFAVIYEHNAINAGLPVIVCSTIETIEPQTEDIIQINLETGMILNLRNDLSTQGEKFSGIKLNTYVQITY